MKLLMALRRYYLADDDEAIHWTEYAWAALGYGFPIVITAFTLLAVS